MGHIPTFAIVVDTSDNGNVAAATAQGGSSGPSVIVPNYQALGLPDDAMDMNGNRISDQPAVDVPLAPPPPVEEPPQGSQGAVGVATGGGSGGKDQGNGGSDCEDSNPPGPVSANSGGQTAPTGSEDNGGGYRRRF
ncbi:unnamed protein product [Strongylus vulgaris]|uniref:Uncharacterized protein n=1 Tax=Strongylus vulgaris TaxID=40348 RepID=A0A3P7KR94_STRVU|nr:unnamed protein product [Strongylus vulgaris]